jgi:hypothetical protein
LHRLLGELKPVTDPAGKPFVRAEAGESGELPAKSGESGELPAK